MKMKIWTMIKASPVQMGGNPYYPASTEIEVLEYKRIKGFDFFSFKTPKGNIKICESETGGIIADSFDELNEQIKGCSKSFLQDQINEAKSAMIAMREMDADTFFKYYKY